MHCLDCSFYLCENCLFKAKIENCGNNHLWEQNSYKRLNLIKSIYCLFCGKKISKLDFYGYNCSQCKLFLCNKCSNPQNEPLILNRDKRIVNRCPQNHILIWGKIEASDIECNKCYVDVDGYGKGWFCYICEFFICKDCQGKEAMFNNYVKPNKCDIRIAMNNQGRCKICLTNQINIAFIPCGHLCVCSICCSKLNQLCPICKNTIFSFIEPKFQ